MELVKTNKQEDFEQLVEAGMNLFEVPSRVDAEGTWFKVSHQTAAEYKSLRK